MNKFKKFIHKSIGLNRLISLISFYAEHLDYLRKPYPNRLSVKNLVELKTSDKIYILGSGASLNDISEVDWENIAFNDSFALNRWYKSSALNRWYKLNFNPTLWMMEPMRDDKLRFEDIDEMQKFLDQTKSFKILKNWHTLYRYYPYEIANSLAFKFDTVVMMRRVHIYSYKQMLQLEKYISSKHFHFYRGSLFLAICMAKLAGYKKIILCGVDLSGGYFWEVKPENFKRVHNTALDKYGVSMKDALLALRSALLKDGITLSSHETCRFNLSSESAQEVHPDV